MTYRAGDPPGAVLMGVEAVQLCEELAGLRAPGSKKPYDYAKLSAHAPNEYWTGVYLQNALFYLSYAQWDLGDHAAAMASKLRRVQLFRRLVEFDTHKYRPGLDQAEQDLDNYAPHES
ncbi:hypothetical protein [Streptomyces sp. Tue6028]|uniref:hypothetical protein n=1 Tax=Streptomyces sp. Tue6028 TaxID=2036037 RepID=UPI003EBE3ED8